MVVVGFWEARLPPYASTDSSKGIRLSNPAARGATPPTDAGDVATNGRLARSPKLVQRVSQVVVEDVDGYETSVHGVSIRSMRTGRGLGPNRVLAVGTDRFVATSVDVGFPMLNRTAIADDRIAVAVIGSAPEGARWSGIDLQPGTVLMYGPEVAHVGINPVGLSFAFAVVELRVVEEFADSVGRRFRQPPKGRIRVLSPLPHATAFADALSLFLKGAAGEPPRVNRDDDVLYWVTAALSDEHRSSPGSRPWRIDRRRIVFDCLDYAEATAHVPSIMELCLAVHVSDRLLRIAFSEETGMSPAAFFRLWALNQAHHRFRATNQHDDTVTNIAFELGISHLGRFSSRYKQLYGVLPSATLKFR